MDKISDVISYINERIAFCLGKAKNYTALGKQTEAAIAKNIANELGSVLQQLKKCAPDTAEEQVAMGEVGTGTSLSWKELKELPEEVLEALSLSKADKLGFEVAEIIAKQRGGIASIDRILVELFKQNGEVYPRATLNARLYRMVQKGIIYSVPGRKGVYSSYDPEEEFDEEIPF